MNVREEQMTSIKPPVTDLDIPTEEKGFYEGFSKAVTLGSKALIGILIVWAIAVPENAARSSAASARP